MIYGSKEKKNRGEISEYHIEYNFRFFKTHCLQISKIHVLYKIFMYIFRFLFSTPIINTCIIFIFLKYTNYNLLNQNKLFYIIFVNVFILFYKHDENKYIILILFNIKLNLKHFNTTNQIPRK